jgi:hypothetical protein
LLACLLSLIGAFWIFVIAFNRPTGK